MTTCKQNTCANCNCWRRYTMRVANANANAFRVANANFGPSQKPKKVVRRDPLKAAILIEQRFKESMQILS